MIVDDEDYPVLSRFSWHFQHNEWQTFPCTAYSVPRDKKTGTKVVHNISITVFLTVNRNGKRAIPINGNFLDCRKENIQLVIYPVRKQHARKVREYMGHLPSSKYKGVSVCSRTNARKELVWRAYINPRIRKDDPEAGKNRKQIYIGTFSTEKEAAKAYNEKARELYGEIAYQNIIEN